MNSFINALSTVFLWIAHPFRSSSTTSSQDLTLLLHSTPFIYYRGTHTYVAFSLLADNPSKSDLDPNDIKVELVQRGWRSGFLGWNLSNYLGANTTKGLDVTCEIVKNWNQVRENGDLQDDDDSVEMESLKKSDSISTTSTAASASARSTTTSKSRVPKLSSKQLSRYDSQVSNLGSSSSATSSKCLLTALVRIPVSSGDGYFRLTLKDSNKKKVLINSPTLRIFSFSLSSASPRGSSILPPTLVPELVLRTLSTIVYTALLGLFPVVALFEKILPRSWSRWILRKLYTSVGGEEKKKKMLEKMKVQEKLNGAKEGIYKTVPFASAGVRTDYDLEMDAQMGRGGVWLVR